MWTVTIEVRDYTAAQEISAWCARQSSIGAVQVDAVPERCAGCHGDTHRGGDDEPLGCEACARGPLCPGCFASHVCAPRVVARQVEGVTDGDIGF